MNVHEKALKKQKHRCLWLKNELAIVIRKMSIKSKQEKGRDGSNVEWKVHGVELDFSLSSIGGMETNFISFLIKKVSFLRFQIVMEKLGWILRQLKLLTNLLW